MKKMLRGHNLRDARRERLGAGCHAMPCHSRPASAALPLSQVSVLVELGGGATFKKLNRPIENAFCTWVWMPKPMQGPLHAALGRLGLRPRSTQAPRLVMQAARRGLPNQLHQACPNSAPLAGLNAKPNARAPARCPRLGFGATGRSPAAAAEHPGWCCKLLGGACPASCARLAPI